MPRKKNIKENQDQHNKSDWGGPQQDNQTQNEILTGRNKSLNENVTTKDDLEENGNLDWEVEDLEEKDLDDVDTGEIEGEDEDATSREEEDDDDTNR
jgi:hypothetical protein